MTKTLWRSLLCAVLVFSPIAALAKTANDPYSQQWGYDMVNVYEAWDYTTGSSETIVAVIDNGFDHKHPDLVDNIWINSDEIPDNGIDDDKNGFIDDVYGWNFVPLDYNNDGKIDNQEVVGNNNPLPDISATEEDKRGPDANLHHGTAIAGVIGARGNNGRDGSGINWQVQLMNLKALDEKGIGNMGSIVRAIYYAVDNGADIINISLVGPEEDPSLKTAIDYAYQNNVLIVAAAGNNRINLNGSPRYPICSDAGKTQSILGVTAVNQQRYLATFSNRGSDCVNITAPGVQIGGPLRYDPAQGLAVSFFQEGYSGTSLSTPFVSGAAALIKSLQPTWGVDDIIETITSQVYKTPPDDEQLYANLYGSGLLQIDKAVAYAAAQVQEVKKVLSSSKSVKVIAGFDIDRNYFALKRFDGTNKRFKILSNWKEAEDFKLIQNFGEEQLITLYKEEDRTFTVYFHFALNPFAYKTQVKADQVLDYTATYNEERGEYVLVALVVSDGTAELREYSLFGTLFTSTLVSQGSYIEGKLLVRGSQYDVLLVGLDQLETFQIQDGTVQGLNVASANNYRSVVPIQYDSDVGYEFFAIEMNETQATALVLQDNGEVIAQELAFDNVYTGTVNIQPFFGKDGILQALVFMDTGLKKAQIRNVDLSLDEEFWFFSRAKRNMKLFTLY